MNAEFFAGIAIAALALGAMTVLVFTGRATAERLHREGARPYARKRRKGGHG